ncbi:hypothetical protein GCM10009839_64030 [Catenulispora yoronensis]|uniref:Uncharacterized protein n=1 Tax=Catenulispora yoronensis TaxID=450799 RepID=A0ABP5GNE6_9ACTN
MPSRVVRAPFLTANLLRDAPGVGQTPLFRPGPGSARMVKITSGAAKIVEERQDTASVASAKLVAQLCAR